MSQNLTSRPNMFNSLGVGIVAVNKQTGTNEIQVFVKSMFPMADGELGPSIQVSSKSAASGEGVEQSSKVMRSQSVPAQWRGFDSNRITAPDVRVGSHVLLFHIGAEDEPDQLYWTAWDVGPEKHRLETVTYAFNGSNRYDENVPFSPDDYYIMEFSTHLGRILISTSKANGEKTNYSFILNGKDGQFTLMDGEENIIHLNSMKHHILMRNADDSLLSLNKQDVTIANKGDTIISADSSISIVTQQLTMQAVTTNLISETYQIDCPITTINGQVIQNGNLTLNGGMMVNGGPGGGGTINTTGMIVAQQDIIAGGISVMAHTHGVIQHSETTTPR